MAADPEATEQGGGAPAGLVPAAVVVAVVVGGYAVVAAQAFLVPLVLAVFLFVLVRAFDRIWRAIPVVGRRLPRFATTVVSAVVVVALGLGVVRLVTENAAGVAKAAPGYQARLVELVEDLAASVGLDGAGAAAVDGEAAAEGAAAAEPSTPASDTPPQPDLVDRFVEHVNVAGLARTLAAGLAGLVGNAALVLVYLFFLLLERPFFDVKLRALVKDDRKRREFESLLRRIDRDVSLYVGLKTFVSLVTALPAYLLMLWVGLDFAEFWAIVIFALNFIPNVGSLIATLLPSTIALVQFDTFGPFWTVALGVTAIQLFVANVIEPNLLGRRLNMSPLVVIVALVGWSLLWGVPGAFLCVPMTNVLILVLANVRSSRWIAVLLSRDGRLPEVAGR